MSTLALQTATDWPLPHDSTAADLLRMDAFTRFSAETKGDASLASDPELVNDFVIESTEYLVSVERHLLSIERNGADGEVVHTLFRAFHTIKGLAGFLELAAIQEVAHEVENTLDAVRSGAAALTPASVETVLQAADYLKACLRVLVAGGNPAQFPCQGPLLDRLRDRNSKIAFENAAPEMASAVPAPPITAASVTVKVDTAKLDSLVDMIGELVIAQSIVRQDPNLERVVDPGLARNLAQLARVTEEVQKTAMSMRMVPIGHLFTKIERVVRDLARKSGKQIGFETSGESAELDRNIVEELADPLVHMIRNSVDHGLETADERIRVGKPARGTIRIGAQHRAGCILIRVSDDGQGLNTQRILEKARKQDLVSEHATPAEDEIHQLIFQPGFSTAQQITDISGRGVGMDVVSRHIQKLRGRIEIQSVPGQGCTFTFRLPLTLAIIEGLVVGIGRERFIIPIFAIREMFSSAESSRFTIEGGREMALLRGNLLPVVRLRERFGIADVGDPAEILIVLQSRTRQFGLAVNRLLGKQKVVIKNLGSCFRGIAGIAGGAILGDGLVGLILDVETLDGFCNE